MGLEDLLVDCQKNFFLWNSKGNKGEMSAHSCIDVERSRFGVHASEEHDVNKFLLLFKMFSIEDKRVIDDLTNKADWGLCAIDINLWHIKIIHEKDELLAWWWPKNNTSSWCHFSNKYCLECFRISEGVEVDGCCCSGVLIDVDEVIFDNSCLTGTSNTNHEDTFLELSVNIDHVALSDSFSSWYNKILEEPVVIWIESLHLLTPWLPSCCKWVKVVIIDLTIFWEFSFGHTSHHI